MQTLKTNPILFLNNGDLVSYKHSYFYVLDGNTYIVKRTVSTSLGYQEKILSRVRLLNRLFRMGVRISFQIDDDNVLVFVNKRFYELNLVSGEIRKGFIPPKGIRALKVSHIAGVEGFEDSIVFGGYLSNRDKLSVDIYKRVSTEQWTEVYSFPIGEINHIHNIVADKSNQCVWILTGDFDQGAAIWMAKDNFKRVDRIYSGTQDSRCCIAFPIDGKLLYATDTPFQPNTIRILEQSDNKWQSRKLVDIDGPCIYGCTIADQFVFSTSVEPDGKKSGWRGLIDSKLGSGIKNNYCHIYVGTLEAGFKEIYHVKKDIWSPVLFQFGTLQFPEGRNHSNSLIVNHVATNKYDGKALIINL